MVAGVVQSPGPDKVFFVATVNLLVLASHYPNYFFLEEVMKKSLFAAAVLAIAAAAPAVAWEGKTVACYKKVWVNPTYTAKKELVMAAHSEYKHVGKEVHEIYYPPVYKEILKKKTDGYYVMKKVSCPCNC